MRVKLINKEVVKQVVQKYSEGTKENLAPKPQFLKGPGYKRTYCSKMGLWVEMLCLKSVLKNDWWWKSKVNSHQLIWSSKCGELYKNSPSIQLSRMGELAVETQTVYFCSEVRHLNMGAYGDRFSSVASLKCPFEELQFVSLQCWLLFTATEVDAWHRHREHWSCCSINALLMLHHLSVYLLLPCLNTWLIIGLTSLYLPLEAETHLFNCLWVIFYTYF